MKKLIIMRHGKASKKAMPDMKRPLIDNGIKRNHQRAVDLKNIKLIPDLIISSPAIRAFQTAEIMAEKLNYKGNIELNSVFYFHDLPEMVHQIEKIPNKYNTVMIVGHNPIWTSLVNYFLPETLTHLRTSGVAVIKFETRDWSKIKKAAKKKIALFN